MLNEIVLLREALDRVLAESAVVDLGNLRGGENVYAAVEEGCHERTHIVARSHLRQDDALEAEFLAELREFFVAGE